MANLMGESNAIRHNIMQLRVYYDLSRSRDPVDATPLQAH